MLEDPRAELLILRRAKLARLRRVNAALSRWDEFHAAACLPPELRRVVPEPSVTYEALKELQDLLCHRVADLDANDPRADLLEVCSGGLAGALGGRLAVVGLPL
jgi:hypothetical protein